MEEILTIALHFITALIIGLLVGTERELKSEKEGEMVISGIRTFSFLAVLGFSFTFILGDSPWLLTIGMGALIVVILSVPLIKDKLTSPGLTTAAALVIVVLSGSLAGLGLPFLALFCGVSTYGILNVKEQTHKFAGILSEEDILSAIRFMTVAFILIPLAYTVGQVHPLIGPGNVFDPVKTLLMIVFVSSISFASYLMVKSMGAGKGLEISAFLGGFVSSAASTASLAQKSCEDPSLREVSVRGIITTNTSMILKTLVIISAIGGLMVFKVVAIPLIALFIISLVSVFVPKEGTQKEDIDIEVKTPFAIIPAAKFGVLFTLISAGSYFLKELFGSYGLYAAAFGGIVSTTSVAASLGGLLAVGEISGPETISVLMMSLVFGSLAKIGIAWSYDRELGKKVSIYLVAVSILAVAIPLLTFWIGK